MDVLTEWSDEEFLSYVEIHCKTERAVFHRDMVARLYKMAGRQIDEGALKEFIELHEDPALKLVEEARANQK